MVRQTTDFRATVAAVREETRERLLTLRREREAAWVARRRRTEASPSVPDENTADSTESVTAPLPAETAEAEALAAEALVEPAAPFTDPASADAMETGFSAEPEPAAAEALSDADSPVANESDATPIETSDPADTAETAASPDVEETPPPADSRPLPRHTLAKLRISAAISTATAGLTLHPPIAMMLAVEPEPEPAPEPAKPAEMVTDPPEPADLAADAAEAPAEPEDPPIDDRLIADIGVFGAGLQSRLSTLGFMTVDDLLKTDLDTIETGLGAIAQLIDVDAVIRHVAGPRAPS